MFWNSKRQPNDEPGDDEVIEFRMGPPMSMEQFLRAVGGNRTRERRGARRLIDRVMEQFDEGSWLRSIERQSPCSRTRPEIRDGAVIMVPPLEGMREVESARDRIMIFGIDDHYGEAVCLIFDREGMRLFVNAAMEAIAESERRAAEAEDQRRAEERLPYLVETPAAVRFVSAEPLLGELDLTSWFPRYDYRPTYEYFRAAFPDAGDQPITIAEGIDWVIVGGESGGPAERRIAELGRGHDWVASLRDQCQNAGVPFFFKQWGGIRSKAGGRELDGREWNEFPAVGSAVPS